MMKTTGRRRVKSAEARFYELLGIKAFRRLLFALEKRRHRRDGGESRNYHLKDASVSAVQRYKGYILYNSLLHAVSLAFVLLYFLIVTLLGRQYPVLTVVMLLTAVGNLYCFMLQRYTYLKLQAHQAARLVLNEQRVAAKSRCIADTLCRQTPDTLSGDAAVLQRIQAEILNGSDCFLTDEDAAVMRKISLPTTTQAFGRAPASCGTPLREVLFSLPAKPAVIAPLDRNLSRLQRVLHRDRRSNVLFGYSLITTTEECERAYRACFSKDTEEEIETALSAALRAYASAADRNGGAP